MIIGLTALVIAVSAYIYKEGVPYDFIPFDFFARLGLWNARGPARAITDGTEREPQNAGSGELDVISGSGGGGAAPGYIAGIPSRKEKEELLVVDDDEEEDPTTPTAPVKIQLLEAFPGADTSTNDKRKGKGRATDDDDDDLRVPMFPAANSVQRASRPSMPPPSLAVPGVMAPPSLPVPTLAAGPPSLMAPPPVPVRKPAGASSAANARNAQYSRAGPSSSLGVPQSSSLGVPQSSSLGVPAQRSTLQLPPTHSQPPPKPRQKVILTPGHSPLDWANHQRSLPFVPLRRITPTELATHGARKNASKIYWTVLEGRVYDITPYLPYHPGGEKELLRVAGKDGTKLFNLTHSWVNWDNMLRGCEVGILVSGNEMPGKEGGSSVGGADGGDLESMD
ncbi:hypothetical protein Dda_8707 [Drechslerella dactyloides]|uniref:Cytochrome b5 heme-binding domain-containing protein n=1 Tax=Drechslerella dactyloides TaxID=74499 RepID=A0AAD6NHJ5_DREDA|nr:hypothetical protein Dda_8707 [Drechslerella dactyloides]